MQDNPLKPDFGLIDKDWCRRVQHSKWGKASVEELSLGIAEMDFRPHPLIQATIARGIKGEPTGYAPARGLSALREELASFQTSQHCIAIDPNHVTIAPGVKFALSTIIEALVSVGDNVALVGTPLYDALTKPALRAGGELRSVQLQSEHDWSLDVAELDRTVNDRTRLILINNPHNPTGKVFNRDELVAITDAAERAGATIISDEIYEHLVLDGEHIPISSVSEYAKTNSVIVSGFSKSFNIPGFRIGYIIHQGELIDKIEKEHGYHVFSTSTLSQFAALGCIHAGSQWLEPLKDYLCQTRSLVVSRLNNLEGVWCSSPKAGFLIWPHFSGPFSSQDLFTKFAEAGVKLWSDYHFFGSGGNFVRLNFGTDRRVLSEALSRIEMKWLELRSVIGTDYGINSTNSGRFTRNFPGDS